jgi:hypothetical protein
MGRRAKASAVRASGRGWVASPVGCESSGCKPQAGHRGRLSRAVSRASPLWQLPHCALALYALYARNARRPPTANARSRSGLIYPASSASTEHRHMASRIGPGGTQSDFSALSPQICIKGLSQKTNRVRGPRPPRWPPGPGFLSAERGRAAQHAQLALPVAPVTHQPAPGDTQGNLSRQLAGAVVLGGWSCTSAATHRQRALLRPFISSGLVNARCPGLRELPPKAWLGWLSYAYWPRGGQEEESRCFFTRLF